MTRTRPLAISLAAGVLVLTAACGDDKPKAPDAKAAAVALASAFAADDLGHAPFTTGTATQAQALYDPIVAALGDVKPKVDVTTVEQSASTARATLTWSWDFTGATWTYTDPVEFTLVKGAWVVPWSQRLVNPTLAAGEKLLVQDVTPERGDILGNGGLALVTARPVSQVGIDKTKVAPEGDDSSARDPDNFAKAVAAAGPQAFVEAITYRREDLSAGLAQQILAVPGARIIADELPLAPTTEFAAPILGRVGEVTAEMIAKDPSYRPGDLAGISGLEARYDDQLRGKPGIEVRAVDDKGANRGLFSTDPTPGTDLQTSLDIDLEEEAEQLLAPIGPGSALVAIKPSTGQILAAANGPGNDGQDYATYGQFAPGSTFKSVVSLALLRQGETPNTVVPCTPSITIDGKIFTNHDGYPPEAQGNIPLKTALAFSCNTAFISQVTKLSGTNLFDAGVSLGVGLDHDVGFPAYFGNTDPATDQVGAAAQMIGQGTILASPMAMATVMATIEKGSLVIPTLVSNVPVSPPDGLQPLTATEDKQLKSMLRGVVTKGVATFLLDVPGAPVLAKTGTAQFGTGKHLKTHAWMIAAQGDLAVCVFVDVGESGSGTAGPILEAFLRAAQASGQE
jgi:cell division protein FtsI/penicillin-binding protein 2